MSMLARLIGLWRTAASGSVNQRIFHALTTIVAVSAAVKVAFVMKDIIVAGTFGLGDELDAFLIALVIPAYATTMLTQSFAGAFMPTYIRVRNSEGAAAASRLLSHAMAMSFVLLAALAGPLAALGLPLLKVIAPNFSEAKLALAYHAYLVLLAIVVLDGQLSLWGAVLNAGEKFALVAFTPIVTPLVVIAAVSTFGLKAPSVDVLAWATVAGCAAELAVVGWALARRGLLPVPRWLAGMRPARDVLRQYVPLMLSAMIMGASTVVDQAMASWHGSGSVAALNYGMKIPGILTATGLVGLGTAVYPHFSRLVAAGDYAALRHTLKTYIRWIVILSVPLTLVFMAGSEWLVRMLFERGAFTPADTALVARVQQMYLLQVPFFVLGILGVRALMAMSKSHFLTGVSVVNLAVGVTGNLIFMRWFGVTGIALSNSVVYMISMTIILTLVAKTLTKLESQTAAARA